MFRMIFLVALLTFLCACGRSTYDLLDSGDSQACAQNDVQEQLFGIFKQNAVVPSGAEIVSYREEKFNKLLNAARYSVINATSTKVDAANKTVECAARIKLFFDGYPQASEHEFFYRVRGDLSNKAPIVSTDYRGGFAFQRLLGEAFAPDIKGAQDTLNVERELRVDNAERDWSAQNPDIRNRLIGEVNAAYPADRFTSDQRNKILRVQLLEAQCARVGGEVGQAICSKAIESKWEINEFICVTDTNPVLKYQCGSEPPIPPNQVQVKLPPCTSSTPDGEDCDMSGLMAPVRSPENNSD